MAFDMDSQNVRRYSEAKNAGSLIILPKTAVDSGVDGQCLSRRQIGIQKSTGSTMQSTPGFRISGTVEHFNEIVSIFLRSSI
jgi:hypothetical protein